MQAHEATDHGRDHENNEPIHNGTTVAWSAGSACAMNVLGAPNAFLVLEDDTTQTLDRAMMWFHGPIGATATRIYAGG